MLSLWHMGKCISRLPRRQRLDNPSSAFLDKALSFLSLGLALYVIAQLYGYISKDSIIKHTVRCTYCRKYVSEKVHSMRV